MDALSSSRSSAEKSVSPLIFSDSASSSPTKASRSPKTPSSRPRQYLRRVIRAHHGDDGEEQSNHHHVLSLMFLLLVISLFLMWSLDICCLSFAKRVLTQPQRLSHRAPTPSSSPSAAISVEGKLDTVAAEAKNSVGEFFHQAGNFRCPQPYRFKRETIAQHRTVDDLWIVVDGNVLDVSHFVSQHPGGRALLEGAGGHDMATVFARSHHPSTVSLFASFCIGRVLET